MGHRTRRKPTPEPLQYDAAAGGAIEMLEHEVRRAQEMLAQAEADRSHQAVVAGRRQLVELREKLDALRQREADRDPLEEMSDEELIAAEVDAVQQLPDHLLEPLCLALLEHMGHDWWALQLRRRAAPEERAH